jgi:GDP-L-fucose synthase
MTIFFGGHGFLGKNCGIEAIRPTSRECDLLNYESVFYFLKEYRYQSLNIINAAAKVAGFTYNQSRNVEMLYENSLIALNLMRAIKELNLNCYYLYVSSVCGYKDGNSTEDLFFNEEPGLNNYGYGMSKRLGIATTRSLELDLGNKIKVCSLIPTNMFGIEDDFSDDTSHVIPALIKKMIRRDSHISILGNAANERDFLYVGDLGTVIEKAIDKQITGTYNVSFGESISISSLFAILRDVFEYKGTTSCISWDGAEKRRVDNSKLKSIIDFTPTSLKEGLTLTKKWLETSKILN